MQVQSALKERLAGSSGSIIYQAGETRTVLGQQGATEDPKEAGEAGPVGTGERAGLVTLDEWCRAQSLGTLPCKSLQEWHELWTLVQGDTGPGGRMLWWLGDSLKS